MSLKANNKGLASHNHLSSNSTYRRLIRWGTHHRESPMACHGSPRPHSKHAGQPVRTSKDAEEAEKKSTKVYGSLTRKHSCCERHILIGLHVLHPEPTGSQWNWHVGLLKDFMLIIITSFIETLIWSSFSGVSLFMWWFLFLCLCGGFCFSVYVVVS